MTAAVAGRREESPRAAMMQRGSAGSHVILLHGWGSRGSLWGPVIDALAESHTVTVPDLPGFGDTAAPPTAWSVAEYADWVVALLDRLGIASAAFVGHSHGGRIAIRLATAFPARVERLVLVDSAGIIPARGLAYHARVRSFKALRRLGETARAPAPLRAWVAARVRAAGSTDYRAAAGTVRQSFVRIVNEDLRAELPRVGVPSLLVWGDCDQDTPLRDGQLMERLIPDAGLVILEGAGHYSYAEQPQRFCRIVGVFLGSG